MPQAELETTIAATVEAALEPHRDTLRELVRRAVGTRTTSKRPSPTTW